GVFRARRFLRIVKTASKCWSEGWAAMLDIRVIGELRVGGATAALPASRRARALLGWLAVHPGGHHRSRLAGLFWPDVLDASARASPRRAILGLRPSPAPSPSP